MGFFFGSKYTIVVSSPKLVYEALRKKGDDFAGRFVVPSMDIITKGRGIALQPDLKIWRKARTALMQSVTKKQIGESSSELILEETHSLVHEFVKLCGSKG